MKVLFIASENNMYSGAFLSLVTLVDLLRKRHFIEPLVVLPYRDNGKKLLEEKEIPYVTIRSCNWIEPITSEKKVLPFIKKNFEIVYNIIPILRIAMLAKKNCIDLIHTNSTYSYVGNKAGFLAKIPVIWHLREFLEEDQNNKIWYRKFGYKTISKAAKVVTISDSLKEKYMKLLENDNLVTIPNGIDSDKFYDSNHKYSSDGIVRCVCVGGLYKNKGHEIIIRAAKIIKEKEKIPFTIEIVGDGAYREYLEKLVQQLELNDCILFSGFHRDVVPFYKKSDIVIMSSYSEAFGRVTVEAMMQGLLVVGADSAATREILMNGEYGILFKNKDYEDLANKMAFAMNNPKWRVDMAQKGQKYANRYYTAEKNADRIFDLYNHVLHR